MKTLRSSITLIVLSLSLSGCAQLVTKTYKPRRGGVVKYNTGWLMAEKNRAKALELAAEHCQPHKVSILSEDNRSEFTGTSRTRGEVKGNAYEGTTSQDKENSVYVKFNCVR